MPNIYTTYLLGFKPSIALFSFQIPTALAQVHNTCSVTGEYKLCKGDGGWPVKRRVGLIIGATAGTMVLAWVFWWCCCCRGRARWAKGREKPRPILLSEWRAQQQRERENQEASKPRGSGATRSVQETHANTGARNDASFEEREVVKPPPAYHEVVNDQNRMLATFAIRRHKDGPTPSYLPPVGSARAPRTTPATPLPYYPPPQER